MERKLENYSLEAVKQKLGVDEAVDMFEYALPRISERKNELLAYIKAENWEAVSNCSHTAISSVRLYGTESLERVLREVKRSAEANKFPANLEVLMSNEFDLVSNRILLWLKENKK